MKREPVGACARSPGTNSPNVLRCCCRRTTQLPFHQQVPHLKIVLDWLNGAISPMAKCWTTEAGQARCGRLLATVSGFSKGVVPEATSQRLCRHSPVPSQHDNWPGTTSNAMLASPMQKGGTDQFEATQKERCTHDST